MCFQPYIGQKPRVAIADHLGLSLELLGGRKGEISARYRGLDSNVSDQISASFEGPRDHLKEAIPSVKKGTGFVDFVPPVKEVALISYWCTSLLLYLSLKSRKKSVKLVLVNPLCFCYIIPMRITLVSELCSNHHLTPRKKKNLLVFEFVFRTFAKLRLPSTQGKSSSATAVVPCTLSVGESRHCIRKVAVVVRQR